MTIEDLKAISEKCKSDADFLAHPDVRRAYWLALGVPQLAGAVVFDPCPILGSLPDACEALRAQLAEQEIKDDAIDRTLRDFLGSSCDFANIHLLAVDMDARDRFMIFAAALLEGQR